MANIDNLPVADTASTPTSSRRQSRARRSAETQAAATTTETAPTEAAGDLDGLPPRTENTENTETTVTSQPAAEGDIGLPERAESNNTTETQAAAEAPKEPTKLLILSVKNPKRAGSIAHGFFQKYFGTGENPNMTTVEEAYERGVRGKDRSWDADRGHILIGDDVDAYLALESDDAKRDWLAAKFKDQPKDRLFKMVGLYVEAPKEAAEAVQTAVEGEVLTQSDPATGEVKTDGDSPADKPVEEAAKETVTA